MLQAIVTDNLDAGGDQPKLARDQLLTAIQRLNQLTAAINATVAGSLDIENNVSINGLVQLLGNVQVGGALSFPNAPGTLGQVLASQGSGQPVAFVDLASAKYAGSSITSQSIDATTPKTITVDKKLSYTAGQPVVVANDATHYMSGTVQSYDPATGILTFANTSQVGTGTFAAWSCNLSGANGAAGGAGSQWFVAPGAPSPGTGVNGDMYLNTTTSDYYKKIAGAWLQQGNLQGLPGNNGTGGGSSTVYGTVSRYQASTTTGLGITIESSSSVKTGIAWSRATTVLTITDNGHGRSVGEWAIVRNTNVPYQDGLITSVTTNTYTINCTDTGASSGSAGAYTLGFTASYTGAPSAVTGTVLVAPANWDCVLMAIRLHIGPSTRGATTHNVTVPKGNINGNGPSTSMDNISIPNQTVRQDGNTLSSVGATIAVNLSGDFGIFQFAALPAATTGIHIVMNF